MSGKPKILCVDDKADNLRIRTMLLEQFGCETITALDHNAALRACMENRIDLALIDYHLARGETGDVLAHDIRLLYPKIPLIMLTGNPQLPAGASETVDATLIKGQSSPEALFDLIERLLPDASLIPRSPVRFGRVGTPKGEADAGKRGKAS